MPAFRLREKSSLLTPLPHTKNKDTNKPQREGRKNLTNFYVCFRPTAATALLGFYLLLRCFRALDSNSQVLYTQTAKGFLQQAGAFVTDGNQRQVLIAEWTVIAMHREPGKQKYQSPWDLITKIAVSSFPQALTRPVREKISSGDDYGSHTSCNKHFQISCLPAYYYCYSLFAKRWQKAKYNKQKNRKLHSSCPRNLRLVLHSVPPGCKSRLLLPLCLSDTINEGVEQPVVFEWLGRDDLNSLNSQSLNSLQVAKHS